ncbi:MAG TPA: flavoprotein, partial [Candidatus Kapabacteria bacterium]
MKETSKIVFKAMLSHLNGKSVILGVTGSIAAVKAAALARELVRAGAAVTCVMTESAEQFVSREEMREATGKEIIGSLFPGEPPPNPRLEKAGGHVLEKPMGQVLEKIPSYSASLHSRESFSELTWHVHLARSCDAMLIAPCSATTIGKLRVGIYDNAVTLAAASLPKGTPLIIVPAMDEDMW